jgi:hypothetical protein
LSSKEVWAAGEFYEPYVARWSRLVARDFLAWLAMPPDKGHRSVRGIHRLRAGANR